MKLFLVITFSIISHTLLEAGEKTIISPHGGEVLKENTIDIDSIDEPIKMLKIFYNQYITENSKLPLNLKKIETIIKEYCTENMLQQLDNPDLDYDLFVDGHFCEEEWINTMTISEDSLNRLYTIIFPYRLYSEEKQKKVKLQVVKEKDGYKIDKIFE